MLSHLWSFLEIKWYHYRNSLCFINVICHLMKRAINWLWHGHNLMFFLNFCWLVQITYFKTLFTHIFCSFSSYLSSKCSIVPNLLLDIKFIRRPRMIRDDLLKGSFTNSCSRITLTLFMKDIGTSYKNRFCEVNK